jgi:hypothetical protein
MILIIIQIAFSYFSQSRNIINEIPADARLAGTAALLKGLGQLIP